MQAVSIHIELSYALEDLIPALNPYTEPTRIIVGVVRTGGRGEVIYFSSIYKNNAKRYGMTEEEQFPRVNSRKCHLPRTKRSLSLATPSRGLRTELRELALVV